MFVKKGDVTTRREGGYPQSCAKRMTAPSAEGAFWGPRLRTRDFVPAGTTKGRSPSGGFAIALWKPSPDHSSNCMVAQRRQVAAALSAAVTTTKQHGATPNSQGQIV